MTGEELKALRESLNMTQLEFSFKLGVARSSIAVWERDLAKMSNLVDTLIRLKFNLPTESSYIKDDRHPDLF